MRAQQIEEAANRIECNHNFMAIKQPSAARLFRSIAERSDANGFVRMSERGLRHIYDGEDIEFDSGLITACELIPIYNKQSRLVAFVVVCLQPEVG